MRLGTLVVSVCNSGAGQVTGRGHSTAAACILAAAATALLAGCGGKPELPPPPPEIRLSVSVSAAADVNPDRTGRPSPVAVSVLQLKTADSFRNADFFAAAEKPDQAFGADLIGREQIMIQPGETRQLPVKVDPAASFIGVVAAFRDIEKASWRADAPLPIPPANASGPQDVTMTIRLESLKVSIETGKP